MVGRNFTCTDLRKITRITAVIASDDDSQIEVGVIKERLDRVLAVLGCTADSVECTVMFINRLLAVTVSHRLPYQLPNFKRFRHEHSRLVGQSNAG